MLSQRQPSTRTRQWTWPTLLVLLAVQLWTAHACVFFAHEFSHSFVAWMLGWKTNPLALHYGHPAWTVFLIQLGIDQNVDEIPIFASGHGTQAAIISGAGAVLGNALITYPIGLWGSRLARRSASRGCAMFSYWVCVASIGNLIDYVPIRTFTDRTDLYQDMYAVERGFGWSPWTLLFLFGVPTALVLAYFLLHMEPRELHWLFPDSMTRRVVVALLTAFVLFDFYGAAGLIGGGPVSHTMSLVSVYVAAPLAAILGGVLAIRSPKSIQRSNPT